MRTAAMQKWYDHRGWALALGISGLVLAYVLASRALDTGSLGQYALALLALGLGLNRLFRAAWPKRRPAVR